MEWENDQSYRKEKIYVCSLVVASLKNPVRRPSRQEQSLTRAEFNLADGERPAAEPAAVGIHHHGIDLPGCFHCVVCLPTLVTDVSGNIPDNDNSIPDPCDELCRSFLQGSSIKCTSLSESFLSPCPHVNPVFIVRHAGGDDPEMAITDPGLDPGAGLNRSCDRA